MTLLLGDCLDRLAELPENSVDAIVTDPPYGLSFMGKSWDYQVPTVAMWQACLRVLKPGGYLLSFAGTRTQHRMAVRIEDAGFEIRDMIAWVYGSGFPKSLNIGKAVDKMQGNERESLGIDKTLARKDGRKGESLGMQKGQTGEITKGTSAWEGWGTALKPALEPITVARKPLSEKTVALNCLKWGVGGINIDGSRVSTEDNLNGGAYADMKNKVGNIYGKLDYDKDREFDQPTGRFPANFIHDGSEEVVGLFPNTKSAQSMRGLSGRHDVSSPETQNIKPYTNTLRGHNDSGSASRFFYCAKASKAERNKGCEDMEEKNIDYGERRGQQNSLIRPDGSERKPNIAKNNHPTVKPIALMEYLINLVSTQGATILDPFMGSGSTGIACKKLGREFIGIELDPEYMEIARARIFNAVEVQKNMEAIDHVK